MGLGLPDVIPNIAIMLRIKTHQTPVGVDDKIWTLIESESRFLSVSEGRRRKIVPYKHVRVPNGAGCQCFDDVAQGPWN